MKKTRIDWCDLTWNPVTGCLHGCEYCYARRIANRFAGGMNQEQVNHDLPRPLVSVYRDDDGIQHTGRKLAYPFGFDPTFHRYKLDEPQHCKKPHTIFVCSMADMFGEWVPETWIEEVLNTCQYAPQHRYLYLTKNASRYDDLLNGLLLPKGDRFWYGQTHTGLEPAFIGGVNAWRNTFLSMEPLLAPMEIGVLRMLEMWDWVIVGAETGNRKGKVVPKREWIEEIAEECDVKGIPVFMKDSLRELMGSDFRQEFPW